MPNLPLLADDELEALFGDDPDGARRYRLLHAVLVRGVTQREAAAEAGVSERTVRNVLRAFTRGGSLDTLRTRSGPQRPRRSRRASAFERALDEALAAEPQAGGDRLWRRAQEVLGADGAQLSRRTAYRLLAQLRSRARQGAPADVASGVRGALPLLLEDPPLALGATPLAQRMLPEEGDALRRGALLQQALRAALERLRPAGSVSTIDRSWWPYMICTGEYETEQSRAELQRALALSASTYSRAKRQAIERIAASLPQIVEQLTAAPAALAIQRLPRTPDFVGRHEEQAYYAWRLQAEGRAHIWGLPGSGKTVLAAELAAEGHRFGQRVVWHTCATARDATAAGIARSMAQALATSPDDELALLSRQPAAGADELPVLLDALRERLEGQPTLVVLDDAHRVERAEAGPALDVLDELVVRGLVRLLLVSRARPDAHDWPALPGMREAEARLLWGSAPQLPADQWQVLYEATGGLPQPIRLAEAAWRRAGELARQADWAAALDAWAQDAVWSQLERGERRALAAALLATARGLAGPEPVWRALDVGEAEVAALRERALLPADGAPLAALMAGAALALRDDGELRAALEQAASRCHEEADAAAEPAMADAALAAQPAEPAVAPPERHLRGMELLAQVRRALRRSSAYLQGRRDDEARQLVHELAQIQRALPDPSGPRTPRPGRVRRRSMRAGWATGE